jgi:phosphoribosyl-AMP cyclohydrolase
MWGDKWDQLQTEWESGRAAESNPRAMTLVWVPTSECGAELFSAVNRWSPSPKESEISMLPDVNGPDFEKTPLVPVIAQDDATGAVLMLAYMNAEAYAETLKTGRVVYYSRSRQKLWRKGEESGNVQQLKSIYFDCDADAVLVKVHQVGGAACHEGFPSCFFRQIDLATQQVTVVGERVFDPQQVYGKSH